MSDERPADMVPAWLAVLVLVLLLSVMAVGGYGRGEMAPHSAATPREPTR